MMDSQSCTRLTTNNRSIIRPMESSLPASEALYQNIIAFLCRACQSVGPLFHIVDKRPASCVSTGAACSLAGNFNTYHVATTPAQRSRAGRSQSTRGDKTHWQH
ncbi:hypothetical protein XU18_0997 [Perkinsela sp. CCAP 1560/4]|nr:hypothetical protein XU18_2316 [Perkinsela sp. CCAP 1560/4]KNH08428.1 hypothetical protein XU18_0997 [Perkinsela sp. CCAP 1560/4]|eukprot:KNH06958.1 hypothetical protein XU18_2316 [Perkinsela sp. CCAP 1560/4]